MPGLIRINNTDVTPLTHQSLRVITLDMMDELHERPKGTAYRNFNKNKKRLTEGKHYFLRNSLEAQALGITAPNGLVLLSEAGYLTLVKSFRDDLAWQVQEQLVETYFRVNSLPALTPAEMLLQAVTQLVAIEKEQQTQRHELQAQAQRLAILEAAKAPARPAPAGKMLVQEWLRTTGKPRLYGQLWDNLKHECRRREVPEMWRPDHYDYPLPYYTPATIASAYLDVTRQITFLNDPGVPYRRQSSRRNG